MKMLYSSGQKARPACVNLHVVLSDPNTCVLYKGVDRMCLRQGMCIALKI